MPSLDVNVSPYEIAELVDELSDREMDCFVAGLDRSTAQDLLKRLSTDPSIAEPKPCSLETFLDLEGALERGDVRRVANWLRDEVRARLPKPPLVGSAPTKETV